MATYKVETLRSYKVIGEYDNDNGDVVTNNTNVDYSGKRKDLTGWNIIVGLTDVDGKTIDEKTLKELKVGESVSFASKLGSGRKVILLRKQENRSTFEPVLDTEIEKS